MKKILITLSSVMLFSLFAFTQSETIPTSVESKTLNGKSVAIKKGIITPTKSTNQLKAPTQKLEGVPTTALSPDTPAQFSKVQTKKPSPRPNPWSEMSIAEQIKSINQEIMRFKGNQAETLRVEKLEQLLERLKSQNTIQKNP